LNAATGGNLLEAGDLANAIDQDDRVRGTLSTRTLGMLGLPLSWDGEEPSEWFRYAPEPELNKLLKWGLLLGVGLAQIRPNGALESWHPRWIRQDTTTRQWYVTTQQGELAINPGAGQWVLYTPYGSIEPYFDGLWTALAIPWLVKRFAIHDRARASEVFGSAMVVGKTEGASEIQRKRWLEELKGLSRSSRIVLPEGYDIDLLEAQGQTWGIYGQSTDWADVAITIAIAGQIVTTQGQSGFSRGDIHENIANSLIKFGAETFATTLANQYIRVVWGERSYPRWDIDPPNKATDRAGVIRAFGDAIKVANEALAPYSLQVDAKALADQFGIPLLPKVNEARSSQGLQSLTLPDGSPDPKGELFIAELANIVKSLTEAIETKEEVSPPAEPEIDPTEQFAKANAAFNADVKEYRQNGFKVTPELISMLAKAHNVIVPELEESEE
jgi:hypothetical protein